MRRALWMGLMAFAVFVIGVLAYSVIEPYRVEVKEYTLTSPDVPPAFDGARVVLLTDIHRSFYYSQERVGDIVDRANALSPDLVLLGGDYVYGNKDYAASAFAELGRLEAPLGVFAVLGNHDYAHPGDEVYDPGPVTQAATGAGISVLHNAGTWIEKSGERFRLAGVGDYLHGDPHLEAGRGGATETDLLVVLSHQPDFSEGLPPDAVDLVLSGHTHGGQITFFGLWAPLVGSDYGQKYRTGMVVNEVTTVIVSNGTGAIFPPLRFFARPQIVVVTLERAP